MPENTINSTQIVINVDQPRGPVINNDNQNEVSSSVEEGDYCSYISTST